MIISVKFKLAVLYLQIPHIMKIYALVEEMYFKMTLHTRPTLLNHWTSGTILQLDFDWLNRSR